MFMPGIKAGVVKKAMGVVKPPVHQNEGSAPAEKSGKPSKEGRAEVEEEEAGGERDEAIKKDYPSHFLGGDDVEGAGISGKERC